MKKRLFYILIVLCLVGCGAQEKKPLNYMFKMGDLAKFKIDSTTCIIVARHNFNDGKGNRYEIQYKGNLGRYHYNTLFEYELISKW